MHKYILMSTLATVTFCAVALSGAAVAAPDRVVIIRHGEKPETGDNLSCQGENRALQLPKVLFAKFKTPDYILVPTLGTGESTQHARMFETLTPFAVKYNLTIDSKYGEKDYANVAHHVLKQNGTVLLVWEHKAIPKIAAALGVHNPPEWKGDDFDSIWVVTFPARKASLAVDKEGISPSAECSF
jgi:hypothetical protein